MSEHDAVSLPSMKGGDSSEVSVVKENLILSQVSTPPTNAPIGGAASGAFSGVIVYLANTYIVDSSLKGLLVLISPTIGIVCFSVYQFSAAQASKRWTAHELERARLEALRKAEEGLKKAEAWLLQIESDQNATAEHKARAREDVQAIQRSVLKLMVKGIVTIE
jgi:hypothetical protein